MWWRTTRLCQSTGVPRHHLRLTVIPAAPRHIRPFATSTVRTIMPSPSKRQTKTATVQKRSSSPQEQTLSNKKQKKENGGDSPMDYSYSDNVGHDSSKAPNRYDFNPRKGRLPNDVTPLDGLREALKAHRNEQAEVRNVVYWMRMRDLRIEDSRALARASALQQKSSSNGHLIALHVISPQDYRAHDRSPRRIDFTLRALRELQREFEEELNIPFVVLTHEPRTDVVNKVLSLCKEWNASHLLGNIEYEVDELWRDTAMVKQADKQGIQADFLDDTYVVPPGTVTTKDDRPYSVFSPWCRNWTDILSKRKDLLDESPRPSPNNKSAARADKVTKSLFGSSVPKSVAGFECKDAEYMHKIWPAGTKAAHRVLENFVTGKGGQPVLEGPATDFSKGQANGSKDSRLARYQTGRNLMCENGSSRISPYLSAGMISARACLRRTRKVTNEKLQIGRESGPAAYNTEIGFRDFYGHVLAAWPRVCMGHAYLTKYEKVVWEYDDETLDAWKQGRTGYPIVDASMRQGAKQGYMHNRGRMIVAMFLTKHLMQDWRAGESWFMQQFIDGDFASNNGGWQWSASTGTDPQPYFRIFSPLSQSEKCDPDGEYIRHWLPELRNVKGNAIHAPHERLSKDEFAKLGYPAPIVEHKFARERALRRFKNVGEK